MLRAQMAGKAGLWQRWDKARGWRTRLALGFALLACLLALHPATAASLARPLDAPPPVTLQIAPTGWGSTPPEDLRVVLEAVATEFGARFPARQPAPIAVVPGRGPLVLYERRADGAYVVELSARNARWHQFVYQFAHELCHIYSNFDNKDYARNAPGNQWFEESVCEAAALFTLRRLALEWSVAPPAPKWAAHAGELHAYADYFLNEPHRRLPTGATSLATWFATHAGALTSNPYLRNKNELVSNLLLPLFEADPRRWGAIGYLNHHREHTRLAFAEFLASWREACPEAYRSVVDEISALFADTRLAGEQPPPTGQ